MYTAGRGQHGTKGEGQAQVLAKSHRVALQACKCYQYNIIYVRNSLDYRLFVKVTVCGFDSHLQGMEYFISIFVALGARQPRR